MSEGGGCHIQAAAPERDVELREIDLDRVSRLIHRRAGIVLSTNKRAMVYGRLARRVRALGFTCFRDYLDHLEADAGGAEEERFINALTTNLTAFFREPHHFELLARHVAGRESARVWSAAASTGEEAWSIAITLRQAMGEHADAQVLATDVDTEALS